MKTFDLEKYGTTYKIELKITSYMEGNLAVTMTSWENGEPEPWNVLTVNLDSVRPQNCAFIDTNNNGEEILAWIIRHGLAVPTGTSARSGYCQYPEYRFRPERLLEIDPERYSAYLHDWRKDTVHKSHCRNNRYVHDYMKEQETEYE